uniref:Uncharacterized protein n=1 Tax=Knipowitschia caucasica TaxID=637954 RepID=A0AAV2J2J1_KNICA
MLRAGLAPGLSSPLFLLLDSQYPHFPSSLPSTFHIRRPLLISLSLGVSAFVPRRTSCVVNPPACTFPSFALLPYLCSSRSFLARPSSSVLGNSFLPYGSAFSFPACRIVSGIFSSGIFLFRFWLCVPRSSVLPGLSSPYYFLRQLVSQSLAGSYVLRATPSGPDSPLPIYPSSRSSAPSALWIRLGVCSCPSCPLPPFLPVAPCLCLFPVFPVSFGVHHALVLLSPFHSPAFASVPTWPLPSSPVPWLLSRTWCSPCPHCVPCSPLSGLCHIFSLLVLLCLCSVPGSLGRGLLLLAFPGSLSAFPCLCPFLFLLLSSPYEFLPAPSVLTFEPSSRLPVTAQFFVARLFSPFCMSPPATLPLLFLPIRPCSV